MNKNDTLDLMDVREDGTIGASIKKIYALADRIVSAGEAGIASLPDPFYTKAEKMLLISVLLYVAENDAITAKTWGTLIDKIMLVKDNISISGVATSYLTREIQQWCDKMRIEQEEKVVEAPMYYNIFLLTPPKTATAVAMVAMSDILKLING